MKIPFVATAVLCLTAFGLQAQVKIGNNPQNLDNASILELESTSRALVISRVTTAQMNVIFPLKGALIYNTDEDCVFHYDGNQWQNLCNEENTTNVSLELVDSELILTDSDGNTVTVSLAGGINQSFSANAVENFNETITITQTGDNYNFEVKEITGDQIVDGTVNGVDLQNGSVTQIKLAPNSVGVLQMQDNAIRDDEIDYNEVTLLDFDNDAGYITNANIVSPDANNALSNSNGAFYDDTPLSDAITTNETAINTNTGNISTNTADIGANTAAINTNSTAINNHITIDEDTDNENETLTNAEIQGNNLVLTESGNTTTVSLAAFNNSGSDNQQLTLETGNQLTLQNGGTPIDLSPYLDNQNAAEVNVTATADLTSTNVQAALEELQSEIGSFSGADGVVSAVSLTAGNILDFTGTGGGFNGTVNLNGLANTDEQNLSLTGNTLNISGGSGVDLTPILGDTNTTNVSLTEDGTDLILEDSDGNEVRIALVNLNSGIDTNTTVSTLTEDGTDFILTDSDGNEVKIPLSTLSTAIDTDTNTTNVSLTEDGTDLILEDSDGNEVRIALADLNSGIDTNTTVSTITEDGSDFILTDSDGNEVKIPLTTLSTAIDTDTNTTNVSLTEDGTDLILEDSDGNEVRIALADLNSGIDNNTTVSSLTEDGTDFILTDSDGTEVKIPLTTLSTAIDTDTNTTVSTLTEDGTDFILTDSDGNEVKIPLTTLSTAIDTDTNTTNVSLTEDGTDLILEDSDGNEVRIALANLNSGIDNNTTVSTLTEDGTDFILTDSDGTEVKIPLSTLSTAIDTDTNTTNVSLTEDGTDLILEDSDGNEVRIPLTNLSAAIDTDTNTTVSTLSEDGTDFILTDSDGNEVKIPLTTLSTAIDTDTNTTNVSLTEDGTDLILEDSDGNEVRIALADLNSGIDNNTTVSSLTEDGTDFILTNSDGTEVKIPLATLTAAIDQDDQNADEVPVIGAANVNYTPVGGTNVLSHLNGIDVALGNNNISGTTGSIFFADTDGTPTENNAQLFWDNTNEKLYLGTPYEQTENQKFTVDGVSRLQGIKNSNGTAGVPSYRFANNGDTGMFLADPSGILGFSTNDIEALRIDDNQNVGVGTTNPTSTLHSGGSFATSIITTSGNLTLTEIHHTIILTGNHDITLPSAGSATGRIYIIKNPITLGFNPGINGFIDSDGNPTLVTNIPVGVTQLQSDGTNWQQIN